VTEGIIVVTHLSHELVNLEAAVWVWGIRLWFFFDELIKDLEKCY
jgi:hypothetical protein